MTAGLADHLRRRLAAERPPALCVGFSGGPDSTALLHALAQLPEARALALRALHVDHGLQAASAGWARDCAAFCATLGIPLTVVRVHVDVDGEGLEAAARRARHAAFADGVGDGEWLALAQHRDDQVETVLLKLLRGAGPEGLAGMRRLRRCGRGWLWRPLLEVPRAALAAYVARHGLAAIDDPANADPRFSRNVVRHTLVPALRAAFPRAEPAILHAARLCRAAAAYINAQVASVLATLVRADQTLDAGGWLDLPDALRAPVLDAWLRTRGLPAPPDAARAELERQAGTAAPDAVPCIDWRGAEVRVWDGRLHATPPLPAPPDDWQAAWDGAPLALPARGGTLEWVPDAARHAPGTVRAAALNVRLRRGGESLRPAGDTHVRALRDLFQRARVPPWVRSRCPLIYADDELVAVADLWLSARGQRLFAALGARPRWRDRP